MDCKLSENIENLIEYKYDVTKGSRITSIQYEYDISAHYKPLHASLILATDTSYCQCNSVIEDPVDEDHAGHELIHAVAAGQPQ